MPCKFFLEKTRLPIIVFFHLFNFIGIKIHMTRPDMDTMQISIVYLYYLLFLFAITLYLRDK